MSGEAASRPPVAGIHELSIEMPYSSSPVKLYLVEDEPLTLVDTGPNCAMSLAALEAALGALGRDLADIERVLVTHPHIDHFGLASTIVERGGAEVCAIESSISWLEHYPRHRAIQAVFRERLMTRHGVPEPLRNRSLATDTINEEWDPSLPINRALRAGETIEFSDRSLEVLLRPGHSPFDTLFHDARRGILFAGDHLISNISSNPVITPPDEVLDIPRPKALLTYRESLRQTQAMELEYVLAGHGGEIEDHRELIARRFASMERRRERVFGALARGVTNAHEVALALWSTAALEQPYLTLTEVLGYLDILGEAGVVREETDAGAIAEPVRLAVA
jgi:glyoxylase-like metal-dependent hydrolase (beta-lactamase superfamily II)